MTTTDDDTLIIEQQPAPTLPCPTWCAYPAGHGWEGTADDSRGPAVYRYHAVDLLPDVHYAAVELRRFDTLTLETGEETVSAASRMPILVGGDGSGDGSLTDEEGWVLATAVASGSRLLAEGYAAGDPRLGYSNEEWQQRDA